MEFKVVQKELELQSRGWIPTFHDVTREVLEIVRASGVKNGTCCIASHHTTCSVMIQECSHDLDSFDLEYLQHDLLDIMRGLIPDYTEENQYRHPGPLHAQFGRYVGEPGNYTSMNTDGHLRSVFFGRSAGRRRVRPRLFHRLGSCPGPAPPAQRHRHGHHGGRRGPDMERRGDHRHPAQIHR